MSDVTDVVNIGTFLSLIGIFLELAKTIIDKKRDDQINFVENYRNLYKDYFNDEMKNEKSILLISAFLTLSFKIRHRPFFLRKEREFLKVMQKLYEDTLAHFTNFTDYLNSAGVVNFYAFVTRNSVKRKN